MKKKQEEKKGRKSRKIIVLLHLRQVEELTGQTPLGSPVTKELKRRFTMECQREHTETYRHTHTHSLSLSRLCQLSTVTEAQLTYAEPAKRTHVNTTNTVITSKHSVSSTKNKRHTTNTARGVRVGAQLSSTASNHIHSLTHTHSQTYKTAPCRCYQRARRSAASALRRGKLHPESSKVNNTKKIMVKKTKNLKRQVDGRRSSNLRARRAAYTSAILNAFVFSTYSSKQQPNDWPTSEHNTHDTHTHTHILNPNRRQHPALELSKPSETTKSGPFHTQ